MLGFKGSDHPDEQSDQKKGARREQEKAVGSVPASLGRQGQDDVAEKLAGATLTTRGVNSLIRFWLGENGYGPFLKKLKEGSNNE